MWLSGNGEVHLISNILLFRLNLHTSRSTLVHWNHMIKRGVRLIFVLPGTTAAQLYYFLLMDQRVFELFVKSCQWSNRRKTRTTKWVHQSSSGNNYWLKM